MPKLEDLFKVVKSRMSEDEEKSEKKSTVKIPDDLLFKCPRCGAFTILRAARPNGEGRGASLQETPCLQPANHSSPRS